jgi:taurine dioxygenase
VAGQVSIADLAPAVGARIEGIDLSAPLAAAQFEAIGSALAHRGVVLIHHAGLTPARQVEFSQRFGELEINVFTQYTLPGNPHVFVVSNIVEDGKPIGLRDGGSVWHTDMSYAARPASVSFLYGREIPLRDGSPRGDTLFASTTDAFDDLPEATKRKLAPLRAVHRLAARYDGLKKGGLNKAGETDASHRAIPDAVHPIVRRHPVTGRAGLYLNPGLTVGIIGMSDDDCRSLIDELIAHCTKPEYTYRHRWRAGDLVFWDNRCLLHRATMDYEDRERRLMYRTTAIGEIPIPVSLQ